MTDSRTRTYEQAHELAMSQCVAVDQDEQPIGLECPWFDDVTEIGRLIIAVRCTGNGHAVDSAHFVVYGLVSESSPVMEQKCYRPLPMVHDCLKRTREIARQRIEDVGCACCTSKVW